MKDLEREIRQFLKERKWDALRPSDLAKSISIEAAELLELFQWVSMGIAETKKDKAKTQKLKSELADVMTYCIILSITMGFDTAGIILDKLELSKKKYPAQLVKKFVNRKNPGSELLYQKIKAEWRQKGLS